MFEKCQEFLPELQKAIIDFSEPVRVGLRPSHQNNVRLEHIPRTSIIHNYGHGGSGVTWSWGCAQDVLNLINEIAKK
ncbi:FAD-dependent oxidoreductase [Bacillus toyonensis]|uniref:FAD-dependent oxidoreductase n=1 Tax=Bacillus toyonensis TaxID=155322 RepID=UPI000BFDCE67|nr:FAD-dependent oxidoreductase [Bacillus toyonensis]